MTNHLDAEAAEAKARELLDARITAVRSLVASRQAVVDARETLQRLESEDGKAYRAALRDGWTADELKRIGVDEPSRKTRGRRKQAPAADSSATQESAAPEHGSATDE